MLTRIILYIFIQIILVRNWSKLPHTRHGYRFLGQNGHTTSKPGTFSPSDQNVVNISAIFVNQNYITMRIHMKP